MSRICPQCLDSNPSDRSAQADILLREKPDEEEDEEEDEGNVTDDEGDDGEEEDGGYSVRVCPLSTVKEKREDFVKVAEDALENVAILVELL